MQEITIGIPQAIYLTLTFLSIIAAAASHGQKRKGNYNFYIHLLMAVMFNIILFLGGFYY